MHQYRLKRINGSNSWYICWSQKGRSLRRSTGEADRTRAAEVLARFVREQLSPEIVSDATVQKVLEYYRDEREKRDRLSKQMASQLRKLSKWFGPYRVDRFSQIDVDNITPRMMREDGLTDGGAFTRLSYLRAALNLGERHRLIERAPRFRMPVSQGAPRDRWVTKEDAAKVIGAAGGLGLRHTQLALILAFQTAKRLGAILELTWDRVDFVKNEIDFGKGHGKKRRGVVPMTTALREVMLEAQQTADPRVPNVISFRGAKIYRSLKVGLDKACDRAGVERFSMHICRHSACTWMVMAGIPTREAARYAGMTEQMFERVYGKHAPSYLRNAADSLAL